MAVPGTGATQRDTIQFPSITFLATYMLFSNRNGLGEGVSKCTCGRVGLYEVFPVGSRGIDKCEPRSSAERCVSGKKRKELCTGGLRFCRSPPHYYFFNRRFVMAIQNVPFGKCFVVERRISVKFWNLKFDEGWITRRQNEVICLLRTLKWNGIRNRSHKSFLIVMLVRTGRWLLSFGRVRFKTDIEISEFLRAVVSNVLVHKVDATFCVAFPDFWAYLLWVVLGKVLVHAVRSPVPDELCLENREWKGECSKQGKDFFSYSTNRSFQTN